MAVGLKSLVQALTSGISATIGHAYAREDWDELNQKMDLYEYIVFLLVSIFIYSWSIAHHTICDALYKRHL